MRQVQCRKFFATLEPVFVYGAFVFAEEMTGHAVHDHETIAPFFQVLLIKSTAWLTKMSG